MIAQLKSPAKVILIVSLYVAIKSSKVFNEFFCADAKRSYKQSCKWV